MAVGTNLSFKGSQMLMWNKALKLLMKRPQSGKFNQTPRICTKAGVPADSTAGDDPGRVGVFCIDTTNGDVYICDAYTSVSDFSWSKITP